MGVSAIVPTSASSGSVEGAAISLYTTVGLGVGGVFVAIALVFALAYFDMLQGADGDVEIRRYVVGSIVPLFLVFSSIVLYESARITDLI